MENAEKSYESSIITTSHHVYQVGKVQFHVASHYTGTVTIEERLAALMVQELKNPQENEEKD